MMIRPRNLFRLCWKALIHLRESGPRATWKRFLSHVTEFYYEWRLGIDTATDCDGAAAVASECHRYEPVRYSCIAAAMRALTRPLDSDVVLDYGCGQGRVLCFAGQYPFARTIGVEMISELAEAA